MSRIDLLRKNYQRICGLPWDQHIAGAQCVWLAVYDKEDERKLRHRFGDFKEATERVGHHWQCIDFTDAFANWLCSPPYSDYAESYFESPSRLGAAPMAAFEKSVAGQLTQALQAVEAAEILPMFENAIRGRLLVFFPGVYEQDNYRLLDARDGWNYHAVPITASEGEVRK